MIDKNDKRYKFLKGNGESKKVEVQPLTAQQQEERANNIKRLMRYRADWDAMHSFRVRRKRIKRYERGKQWDDKIQVGGKWITEAQHIMDQGNVPLKNNVILQTQNSVVGVFRENYSHPEAIARTRDNQHIGETMTAMLQYVGQINDIKELDASDFMEGLRGGLAVQYIDYQWHNETHRKEVDIVSCSPDFVFMNGGVRDVRGNDIQRIGVLMDMPRHELIQRFAHSAKDEERINGIYNLCTKDALASYYRSFVDSERTLDFFLPEDNTLCRVIQAWELESEESWLVHDRYEQTLTVYPKKDKAAIDAMIQEREEDITLNGLDPEKTKITCEWHNDVYWYVRYMSPRGDILYEGRSPFAHNSHPFTVYMSRLVDGEIYSFEESIIDQQRYINRLITLIDCIMRASAKGVLIFPENAIPAGMDKDDILEQWVSTRGVIFANIKPGMQLPTQISTNATTIGANEMLALQLQLVRDISGVHGAMLGKEAKSGTSGNLYAQETSNAQTNLLDTLESFTAFRRRRDYKIAKTIPQCYDYVDYIPVAGREYSEAAKEWNAELAGKFDYYILITETNNSELYQSSLNNLLSTALQQQLIDFKTALEAGRFPFSDSVLRILERKEQEAAEMQAKAQAMQLQGQAAGAQAAEAGASEAEIAQMQADMAKQAMSFANDEELNKQASMADSRAMQMIQQALG